MFNAIGAPGMYGAAEEALMTAMERAIAVLGMGTVVALALAGLVIGVELLAKALEAEEEGPPSERISPKGCPKAPGGGVPMSCLLIRCRSCTPASTEEMTDWLEEKIDGRFRQILGQPGQPHQQSWGSRAARGLR